VKRFGVRACYAGSAARESKTSVDYGTTNAQRPGCGRRDGMNSSARAVLKTTCALAIWRDTESPRDTDLPEPCHRCGDKLGEADAQSPRDHIET
jgi:hypothetical protein